MKTTHQTSGWSRIDQKIDWCKNQKRSGFVLDAEEIQIPDDLTPFACTSQYFRGPTAQDLAETIQGYLDEYHPYLELEVIYDWITPADLQIQINFL